MVLTDHKCLRRVNKGRFDYRSGRCDIRNEKLK
jgi:hypothetical protein